MSKHSIPPIMCNLSGILLYTYETIILKIKKREHEKNKTRYLLKYIPPAINSLLICVPSIGDDILKIKETKKMKNVIGNTRLVTTLIENKLIASNEKMPKNLKKYKVLEMAESSIRMKEENE